MIPKILFRTVPETINEARERLWETALRLHPDWTLVTLRDPLNPEDFPLTSPHWGRCSHGAQRAGLIRLEYLHQHGGIYLDSDVELFRNLDPLRELPAFAAYEDPNIVPDAVLGAEPGHPAILECLTLAIERLSSASTDWATGNGAWSTGPGVTTTILKVRGDVLILPARSFYPVFYSPREDLKERLQACREKPPLDGFGMHLWDFSWA